jgi:hypothetical protein
MNKSGKVIIFMLLISVLLISCGGQPPASPTPDINALLTQSIGTLSASFFMTQTALVPPATNTPLPTPTPLATSTPLALPSPLPSATQGYVYVAPSITVTGTVYTPTTNPSSLAYGCNNLGLIRDVTIDSGTDMSPGEKFTKTWQVANTGTCDWLYGYRLVPVSGTKFSEEPVRINNAPVPPKEWRQISVSMSAPKDTGTYTQYWQLSDGAGHTFGSLLGVTIDVKKAADTAVPTTYP